jgi:hypothetical protein
VRTRDTLRAENVQHREEAKVLLQRLNDELTRHGQTVGALSKDHQDRYRAIAETANWRDLDIQRVSEEIAVGYINEWNRIRYRSWMKRTRGIGQGDAYHAQFGRERGYYLGNWDRNNGALIEEHFFASVPECAFHGVFAGEWLDHGMPADWIPEKDRITYTYETKRQEPIYTTVTQRANAVRIGVKSGNLGTITKSEVISGYRTVVDTRTEYIDRTWRDRFDAGRLLANVVAYAKWMSDPAERGFGMDDPGHAKWGRDSAKFAGDVDAQGRLLINGFIFDHKKGLVSGPGGAR